VPSGLYARLCHAFLVIIDVLLFAKRIPAKKMAKGNQLTNFTKNLLTCYKDTGSSIEIPADHQVVKSSAHVKIVYRLQGRQSLWDRSDMSPQYFKSDVV